MAHLDDIRKSVERLLPGDPLRETRDKIVALVRASAADGKIPVTHSEKIERSRAELWRRFSSAREDEQLGISRELHDRAGQNVSALLLLLSKLESRVEKPELVECVREIEAVAESLGRDLHRIILQLRPTSLDDLGLIPAVTSLVESWAAINDIEAALHASGFEDARPPRDVETALYRIIEDALSNVVAHTQAKRVAVILERKPGEVCAIVEDDGAGFDASSRSPFQTGQGLGLAMMNERATLLGGTVKIESSKGRGTTIIARIPTR